MTSEHQQTDKSKNSSTNVDSPGQMRGWFKLIETIRKTDPPSTSTELLKPSPNSSNTNGHPLNSPDIITIDSLPSKSPSPPVISLPSSPVPPADDIPEVPIESKPKKGPKRASTRHKKITIRKSTRIKQSSNAPDDDIHQRKSSNECLIPLATDLHSLPGHNQDDLRDKRFLNYSDMNTLSTHLNTCLFIDKKSFSSSSLTKQHIFKTRHNILTKIFKLHYLKTYSKFDQKNFFNKKQEIKPNLISPTSNSFKTDWSVNRRSTSTHRYDPKNVFHILQQNPKQQMFSINNQQQSINKLSDEQQHEINYEHIKSLLVRTYYPHFHAAMKYGHHFGLKSKIPIKNHDLPVIPKSDSSIDIDETMTITLKSPPSITDQESKKRRRRSKHINKPLPITQRRVSEEIPAVMIKESSVIVLPPPPLSEKQINTNNRKRKTSITIYSNINEKMPKRFPSPEYQDILYSDSDDDVLPDELPKQNFIKNGLRSNYYKSTTDITSTKNRLVRQRKQSSGSLPSFYTEIFETEDGKISYIDFQLPFDIYWFSQKQGALITSSSPKPINQNKKKKLYEPKQKQSIPSKRNLPIQQNLLTPEKQQKLIKINKDLLKMEELTQREKEIVSETFIFLKRNLRRIKEKRESKDKNNNQQKQQIDEQSLPLFFSQNYYHPNINSSTEFSNLSHKDLVNLFYNHIRRSHFAKTGQCANELIDKTCYYAQLGQLTLILNELFDLLLNYKCQYSDIYPSNALKKCPLKRLFPMYYELILKPIDLTIIQNKLDNGEYLSYDLFEQDLLLLFKNAITYCGEDSDVGRAVKELQIYFIDILKIQYQSTINLFNNMNEDQRNINNLKDFITHLHEKETIDGQIRRTIYDMIFNIDNTSPIVYKTIISNPTNTHRTSKNIQTNDCIVHCRCGSMYDETLLVQCYACQLWQHASCVIITDPSQPYYCFECHPLCEENPSSCLKTNVLISNDNNSSYSTITRSDGFIVRINECYFIIKQEENSTLSQYDLFFIERLWLDKNNIGQASGFYYIRPYETFHEVNRKFFSNEVFRFPSTNDSIDINSIIRPCYVLDTGTFCKGKPICEYTSRLLNMDLFICEYRVDKLARTFTRLPKSKHIGINTKSYCFDNYIEKLSIKREYQPHQQQSHRRSTTHPIKLTTKQLEERSSHIDGIIEKIYCRFHHPNLIPTETKFSPNQFFQQPLIDRNNNRGRKRLRDKQPSSTIIINKKRRTISISSNEYTSDNTQHIVSLLIDELIELISSHTVSSQ